MKVFYACTAMVVMAVTSPSAWAFAAAPAVWRTHIQTAQEQPLQNGCQPFSHHPSQGKARGTVLLFHGYTACPQQYVELSELLARQGYQVYVPLLPGHGRRYLNPHPRTFLSQGGDDIAQMPGQYELERYTAFADQMAALLLQASGERVVGGLSLGASLALYTAWKYPTAAQRAFVLSPLWDVAGINRVALPVLGPALPYQRVSWGASCEHERALGRAGYCDFALTHVSAVQKLGRYLQQQAPEIATSVQMVGVEQDGAASNEAIATMQARLPNARTCWLPLGASHSMLSPQDNPTRDMFWLPALKEQLVRFVTTGNAFDTLESSEFGLPRCRSR